MNASDASVEPGKPSSRGMLRWVLGTMGVCGFLVVIAIVNAVTLNRDATTLRDELLERVAGSSRTRVQVSVGPGMLAAARTVLGFIPDVAPEAKLALSAVRRASVGVYELGDALTAANRAAVITSVDGRMHRRGWRRTVAVNNDENLVLVYLRENSGSGRKQKICVAVCASRQVVVVSGTIDAASLAELVASQGGFAARW